MSKLKVAVCLAARVRCTSPGHIGYCEVCDHTFCRRHFLDMSIHVCLTLSDKQGKFAETSRRHAATLALVADINLLPLKKAAMALNPAAKTCKVNRCTPTQLAKAITKSDTADPLLRGCCNAHIHVTFEGDDPAPPFMDWWLARIRLRENSFADQPASIVIEAATMTFLHSRIPDIVPNAWMPPVPSSVRNFFFIQHVKGDKYTANDSTTVGNIAKLICSLTSVPIDTTAVGGLYPSESAEGVVVGPLHNVMNLRRMGPFGGIKDLVRAEFQDSLTRLTTHFPHVGRIRSARQRVHLIDEYLVHLDLLDLVAAWDLPVSNGRMYVQHPDEKRDIFLMRDGQLVAALDWEGAYTAPLAWVAAWPFERAALTPVSKHQVLRDELHAAFADAGRMDLVEAVAGPQGEICACLKAIMLTSTPGWPLTHLHLRLHKAIHGTVFKSEEEWMQYKIDKYGLDEGYLRFKAEMEAIGDMFPAKKGKGVEAANGALIPEPAAAAVEANGDVIPAEPTAAAETNGDALQVETNGDALPVMANGDAPPANFCSSDALLSLVNSSDATAAADSVLQANPDEATNDDCVSVNTSETQSGSLVIVNLDSTNVAANGHPFPSTAGLAKSCIGM